MIRSFLEDILDVVHDDPLEGAVVDLAEFSCGQVDYETATKVALRLDQMADLSLLVATSKLLSQVLELFLRLWSRLELLEDVKSLLLGHLSVIADLEAHIVDGRELGGETSRSDHLFFLEKTRIVHLSVEKATINGDSTVVEALLDAEDGVSTFDVAYQLVVVGAREDVADGELRRVPLVTILANSCVDIREILAAFLVLVLDILKDNGVDSAVIDEAVLLGIVSLQVYDLAATQIIFHIHHMAGHCSFFPLSELLGQISHSARVSEAILGCRRKKFLNAGLLDLLGEVDSEDDIAHRHEELSHTFLVKVADAVVVPSTV